MPIDPDSVTRWAGDVLLTASLQGGVVIAVIWVATRSVATARPSLQAALWWVAALKLLLILLPVPSLAVPLLAPRGHFIPATDSAAALANVRADGGAFSARSTPSLPHQTPPTTSAGVHRWLMTLIGVWFIAVGLRTVHLLKVYRTIRGVVRRSTTPVPEVTGLVAQLAEIMRLTRVPQVRSSDEIGTPQLAGVHRPIVLVPADITSTFTSDERAMALCHELMHIRRCDLALGWVPALAEHLFFFHPLVCLAAREYVLAREAACDAAVVRVLGVPPQTYGRLLVRIGVANSASAFAVGGASSTGSSLRRRLEMLQHVGSATVSRRSVACIATVMIIAIVPFRLVARAQPEHPARSEATIREVAADPVTLPAMRSRGQDPLESARVDEPPALQVLRAQLEEVQRRYERIREAEAATAEGRGDWRLRGVYQQLEQLELQRRALIQHVQQQVLELETLAGARVRSETYSRGEIVVIGPATDGSRPPDSRVLAIAGDGIQIARTGIVVNGVPVAGIAADFLAGLPEHSWETVVPARYYFVAADHRTESGVSRFWGLIPAARIVGRR